MVGVNVRDNGKDKCKGNTRTLTRVRRHSQLSVAFRVWRNEIINVTLIIYFKIVNVQASAVGHRRGQMSLNGCEIVLLVGKMSFVS